MMDHLGTADGEAATQARDQLNQILLRVGQGDEKAFAELYRLTSSKVFGMVVRMLHDRAEAEDVLQDVYATVWRRADTFDLSRGGALTWLMALGHNRAIDPMRRHREAQLDEEQEEEIVDEQPLPRRLPNAARSGGVWNAASKRLGRSKPGRCAKRSSPVWRIANLPSD